MATLQVPPAFISQTSRLFNDHLDCPSPSPSVSSVDMQDCTKKTMQTTVAIRDEDPHHFKIRPLKQVPPDERPGGSPLLQFDRPFTGPRLGLPTLYQLAPNRSASACSFNSLQDEQSSISRPGSPPPHKQRSRGLSSTQERKPGPESFGEDLSALGLTNRNSMSGSAASLRSTTGENSQEHLAQTLMEYDMSKVSFLHSWSPAPDLTFETSNELSGTSSLHSPLTSTPSSESVRKTQSMRIDSPALDIFDKLPLDPPSLGPTDILRRRARTKAFSVSSLSSSHSREEMRAYNQKRNAIYGDSDWQVDLPSSDSCSSSVTSTLLESSPSKTLSYASPPRFFGKKTSGHASTRSEMSSRQVLGFKDVNRVQALPSLPVFRQPAILPLRVTTSNSRSSLSSRNLTAHNLRSGSSSALLVQELLEEIDEAIEEWKVTALMASF